MILKEIKAAECEKGTIWPELFYNSLKVEQILLRKRRTIAETKLIKIGNFMLVHTCTIRSVKLSKI